jgi:regulator of replication initiation timing
LRNPAYVGRPAWGKNAIGYYRQAFDGKSEAPKQRKREEPITYDKGEKHYVYPRTPVFSPDSFMPVDLWERVHNRIMDKKKEDRKGWKTRDIAKHPLAGILVCPDCGLPMDISGSQSKGNDNPIRYFICSTYVKTRRRKCRANSVQWKYLDAAAEEALSQAMGKLEALGKLPSDNLDIGKVLSEERRLWPVIGRVFHDMLAALGRTHFNVPVDPWNDPIEEVVAHKKELKAAFNEVYRSYQTHHRNATADHVERIKAIETELDRLADLAQETPSERQRKRYWQKSTELEAELDQLQAGTVSLVDRLSSLVHQANALHSRLDHLRSANDSQLFRVFLEKIVPQFKRKDCKDGIQRSYVEGFQFVPKESLSDAIGGVMEVCDSRRDRD